MKDALILGAAVVVDGLVGDPRWLPHPVVLMGKLISWLEKRLNHPELSAAALRRRGVITVVTVVAASFVLSAGAIVGASLLHPVAGIGVSLVLLYFSFAGRSLAQAAQLVASPLRQNKLAQARQAIAMFVGRDTQDLPEGEIARATIETVAENYTDGYVAPLFYACLGGAPLAMAYKAVNTMDSMLGYKNERYLHFGWAAARFDDLANYLPARLAALGLLMAGAISGKKAGAACRIWRRDAKKHPSPNGGATEAVMAGLLGITLGGINYYGGIPSQRGVLGDAVHPLSFRAIDQALVVYILACLLAALLAWMVVYYFGGWLLPWFRVF